MKPSLLTIVVLAISLATSAQDYTFYSFPRQIPDKYKVDVLAEKEKITNKRLPGVKKRTLEQIAEIAANTKLEMVSSGYSYINWDKPEAFLNDILQRVTPDSLKGKGLRVYIARSSDFNAHCIYDGTIFINVGYLANVHNEAGLYFTITHELAHFMYRDFDNRIIGNSRKKKEQRKSQDISQKFDIEMKYARYSQEQESRCDSIACVTLSKLGYKISDFIPDFESMLEDEERFKKSVEKKRTLSQLRKDGRTLEEYMEDVLATHPEISYRIRRVTGLAKRLDNDTKQTGNSPQFAEFKQAVSYENLSLQLNENNLSSCTQNSMAQLIMNPNDSYFLYFLLESLRRQIYQSPSFGDKSFITCYYIKVNQEQGILSQLDLLFASSVAAAAAKNSPIVQDKSAFVTNKEAFEYFAPMVEKLPYTESFLTVALYYHKRNDDLFAKNIHKYLEQDNIQKRAFAESLKNNTIDNFVSDKRLVIIDNISLREHSLFGTVNNVTLARTMTRNLFAKTKGTLEKQNPGHAFELLQDICANDMQKTITYSDMMQSINVNLETQADDQKVGASSVVYFDSAPQNNTMENTATFDLFLYKPEVWNFMVENKLSAINLMHLDYNDEHTQGLKFIYCCYPAYALKALFYWPYLLAINNFPENTIDGHLYKFDRYKKGGQCYYNNSLFRKLSRKNFAKITRRCIIDAQWR